MSNYFEKPAIYVVCLAAHNRAMPHGCWITVNDDVDKLRQAVQKMLAKSPIPNAKKWAIRDSKGFGKLTISESESFESVCEKAEFVREYGELGTELAADHDGDLRCVKETLDDYYNALHESYEHEHAI